MQFLRSPLYFHTSSSGGQLSQTHLGYCSALYKSILPKMYSQPLPRTSLTPSQPPFSHFLYCSLFFSIPFSIAAFLGFSSCLLVLAVLLQVCPRGQEKKESGVFLVGLHCSPGKSQEIFWRAKLQAGSSPCSQEVGKNRLSPEEESPPSSS